MGKQLNKEKKTELQGLLQIPDVLQKEPGRTTVTEHNIWSPSNARPVRQPPYRLPHAYRETVREEFEDMLKAGIIEPSNSELGLAYSVGEEKATSMPHQSNAYPMPRVDKLID